jgi:hypothetical protein
MKKIVEGTNLISQMHDYYDFLTANTQSTSNITWSPPYLDALGLGLMVTAAVPVVTNRYGGLTCSYKKDSRETNGWFSCYCST